MAEYIERQKAIFPLYRWKNIIKNTHGENDEYVRCLTEAIEKIEDVPAADVQPVRHGRWARLDKRRGSYLFYCSECGGRAYYVHGVRKREPVCGYRYCPNCGCAMEDV